MLRTPAHPTAAAGPPGWLYLIGGLLLPAAARGAPIAWLANDSENVRQSGSRERGRAPDPELAKRPGAVRTSVLMPPFP
jgi:hypothetical protein